MISKSYGQDRLEKREVVIDNGQTTSNAIDVEGMILVGIITPPALTGTIFYFKVSDDGDTFYDYYNVGGAEVNIDVAPSIWIGLVPVDFAGVQNIK
jgi:hypothetical protein